MMILPSPDSSMDLRAVTVRPNRGGRKHRALGPPDRGASLPAVPRHRRQGSAPCRAVRRDLARAGRLAAGRVQAGRARPLDRVVAGAAVPACTWLCNNSRFVFLTPGRVPNLASRVPPQARPAPVASSARTVPAARTPPVAARPEPPPRPVASERASARPATGSQPPGCTRGRGPPGRWLHHRPGPEGDRNTSH